MNDNGRKYFPAHLLLAAVPAAVVSVLVMLPLVNAEIGYFILDGIMSGMLLVAIYSFLRGILRFVSGTSLPAVQKYINYTALGILFTVVWVGMEVLLLFMITPSGVFRVFALTIPLRVALAMLAYWIMVMHGEYATAKAEAESPPAEEIPRDPGDAPATAKQHETLEHIAVKSGLKIVLVLIPEIVAMQAEGDYVLIHTVKGKFIKEQTMKYFAGHLPANKFVRVHRSYIVNIDHIARIEAYEKQQQIITLSNNMRVKTSTAGYRELKKALGL